MECANCKKNLDEKDMMALFGSYVCSKCFKELTNAWETAQTIEVDVFRSPKGDGDVMSKSMCEGLLWG